VELKKIDNQIVVIMGATGGIGRQTARLLARRGAKLVLSGRDEEGLRALCQEIGRDGGSAIEQACDVTNFEQVKNVAQRAVNAYGRLDTWVHLAAIHLAAPFERTTPEQFRNVVEVNLVGQAYGAMAALPEIKKEGRGCLIHVTSVESEIPLPLQSAYAASKAGASAFLDSLRMELEREGVPIAVADIKPGAVDTPSMEQARNASGAERLMPGALHDARMVAEVILYATEHPTREMYAGGGARMLALAHRLSPRLTETLVMRQLSGGRPRQTNGGLDLPEPHVRFDSHGEHARQSSVAHWMETHPGARRVLTGGIASAAGIFFIRAMRRGHD
jgi:NADP-dependent 3-hydroxy acid dehydrogenase YdfG